MRREQQMPKTKTHIERKGDAYASANSLAGWVSSLTPETPAAALLLKPPTTPSSPVRKRNVPAAVVQRQSQPENTVLVGSGCGFSGIFGAGTPARKQVSAPARVQVACRRKTL